MKRKICCSKIFVTQLLLYGLICVSDISVCEFFFNHGCQELHDVDFHEFSVVELPIGFIIKFFQGSPRIGS
jgi:hypothetical protein